MKHKHEWGIIGTLTLKHNYPHDLIMLSCSCNKYLYSFPGTSEEDGYGEGAHQINLDNLKHTLWPVIKPKKTKKFPASRHKKAFPV